MKSKIHFKLLLCYAINFCFSGNVIAQQMSWLQSVPSSYGFNPELTSHSVLAWQNNIFAVHLDSLTQLFGSDLYGNQAVECYDSTGSLIWSNHLDGKVMVECMANDSSGNIFLGGSYMETMHLGNGDSLVNTGSGFNTNYFLVSFDKTGLLRYKRNVFLTNPNMLSIGALAIDQNGFCWYAMQEFANYTFTRLDPSGADLNSFQIIGTRLCKSFCFDPENNMFIAGSTEQGSINVAGSTFIVPDSYMMFLTRVNAGGQCSWVRLAHDVTFQTPQVVSTLNGGALLSCNLMDSTTWGSVSFHGPQWVYDVFLTEVDSSGNFLWGAEPPLTATISGDFQPAAVQFMDVDAHGNIFLLGRQRGSIDWGNGVLLNTGIPGTEDITVLSFNHSGNIRWGFTGGSTSTNFGSSIAVSGIDEGYFSAFVNGTATFGQLSTNNGGTAAFLLGKFSGNAPNGILDINSTTNYRIFPNPISDRLEIRSEFMHRFDVQLIDVTGKVLDSKKSDQLGSMTLSCAALSAGLYFVKLLDQNGVHLIKILKN